MTQEGYIRSYLSTNNFLNDKIYHLLSNFYVFGTLLILNVNMILFNDQNNSKDSPLNNSFNVLTDKTDQVSGSR